MSAAPLNFLDEVQARQQGQGKTKRPSWRQHRKAVKQWRYRNERRVFLATGGRIAAAFIIVFTAVGMANTINSAPTYRWSWGCFWLAGFAFVYLIGAGVRKLFYLPEVRQRPKLRRWLIVMVVITSFVGGALTGVALANRHAGTPDAVGNWHVPILSSLWNEWQHHLNRPHNGEKYGQPDPNTAP